MNNNHYLLYNDLLHVQQKESFSNVFRNIYQLQERDIPKSVLTDELCKNTTQLLTDLTSFRVL